MKKHQKKISSFLFYDYETFGTHVSLDKPAQFACIRTDLDFNIISDKKCFYCFPSDDYLPDPVSVLITHITPQYTQKYGMNEYNFSKKIHDLFKKPNTCIIGYNNINFDDEITRNLFYRNFFDPYEWSWKNGNSRWDLLYLMRACYALRPIGIKWPKNELGFTSFKLSELTQANNIKHSNAHDATSDVYATIELAKLIKQNQPKLFDFFFRYRQKIELYKLINLNMLVPLVYVSNSFGSTRYNISLILPIVWHKNNKNILISIDILKNVKELIVLCKTVSFEKSFIKNLFHSGIVMLYLNKCPTLSPISTLRERDYNRLNIDINVYKNNINLLKMNRDIIKNIEIIFSQEKCFNESLNVDLQIYNAFFNHYDKKIIQNIRKSTPFFLENSFYKFYDSRLKNLFFRYRARNFFDILNTSEKKKWLKYCLCIFNGKSLDKYKEEIEFLLKKHALDKKSTLLLNQLFNYVSYKRKELLKKYLILN